MIVLLTGKPGSGKSTVVERFIKTHPDSRWVVTASIPRADGWRAGFEAIRYDGYRRVISHKTDIQSAVVIGKNHVDLAAVEDMFGGILRDLASGNGLTIIDEIGPIQLLSPRFESDLERALAGTGPLLATIHFADDRLERFRADPRHIVLTVNADNRDQMPKLLSDLFAHDTAIDQLAPASRGIVSRLLQAYLDSNAQTQLHKLLNNALPYAANNTLRSNPDGTWTINGDHGAYTVRSTDTSPTCNCDLFTGRNQYTGNQGECSHIQAVKIVRQHL